MPAVMIAILMSVVMPLLIMLVVNLIKLPFRVIGGLFRASNTGSRLTRFCAWVCSRAVMLLCRMWGFGRVVLTLSVAVMVALFLVTVTAPYMHYFYGFNPWRFLLPVYTAPEQFPSDYGPYSWWLLGMLVGTWLATAHFWRYRYFHLRDRSDERLEGDYAKYTVVEVVLIYQFGYLFRAIFWCAVVWGIGFVANKINPLPAPFPPLWPPIAITYALVALHKLNEMTCWKTFKTDFRNLGRQYFDMECERKRLERYAASPLRKVENAIGIAAEGCRELANRVYTLIAWHWGRLEEWVCKVFAKIAAVVIFKGTYGGNSAGHVALTALAVAWATAVFSVAAWPYLAHCGAGPLWLLLGLAPVALFAGWFWHRHYYHLILLSADIKAGGFSDALGKFFLAQVYGAALAAVLFMDVELAGDMGYCVGAIPPIWPIPFLAGVFMAVWNWLQPLAAEVQRTLQRAGLPDTGWEPAMTVQPIQSAHEEPTTTIEMGLERYKGNGNAQNGH